MKRQWFFRGHGESGKGKLAVIAKCQWFPVGMVRVSSETCHVGESLLVCRGHGEDGKRKLPCR